MFKKTRSALILPVVLLVLVLFLPEVCMADEPDLGAKSAILFDRNTKQVLYAKDAELSLPPASTTKVMTAILTLEFAGLDEKIEISKHAASKGGSSLYLKPGEVFTVGDLLQGALIKSGNDASVALAEAVAGSEKVFAGLMNEKAALLGAKSTNFVNPNGLPNQKHRSSAYDLMLMADYGLDNPVFAQIVGKREATVSSEGTASQRQLHTTNRLLGSYPGATGVKTGTTRAAGQCLIASAERGDRSLIGVVLKSSDRYGDVTRLLNYGFNEFVRLRLPKGTRVGTIYFAKGTPNQTPVLLAEDLDFTVSKQELKVLEKRMVLYPAKVPLSIGTEVGHLEVLRGDGSVMCFPVMAGCSVRLKSLNDKLRSWF